MLRLRPLTAARLRLRPLTVARLPLVFHCRKAPSLVLLAARLRLLSFLPQGSSSLALQAARLLFFTFSLPQGSSSSFFIIVPARLLFFSSSFIIYARLLPVGACRRLPLPSAVPLRCSSLLFFSALLSASHFSVLLFSALFCSFLLFSAKGVSRHVKTPPGCSFRNFVKTVPRSICFP